MPIVRGRDNHPQCGKLRTNVLLFLLGVLQLRSHVGLPCPLCHTGSCCALFCLFCSFSSFLGSSASVCTRVWKQPLLQSEMGPLSCWVPISTGWMFWWVSESVLRRSKASSSSTVSAQEEVKNCSGAEAVLISLQPFQLLSLLDESWPPAPRFVNLKSNQQNLWVNFTQSGNDFVWVVQQKKYSTNRNIYPVMCKL